MNMEKGDAGLELEKEETLASNRSEKQKRDAVTLRNPLEKFLNVKKAKLSQ